MWASLLSAGPLGPTYPGRDKVSDPNAVHYVFSHNWAAIIGIIICLCLLHVWFQHKLKWDEDDNTDDST